MSSWTAQYLGLCSELNAVIKGIQTMKWSIQTCSRMGEDCSELEDALAEILTRQEQIKHDMTAMRSKLRQGNSNG